MIYSYNGKKKTVLANGILVCEIMQRRMRHGMVFTDSEPCSNSQVLLFHKYVLRAYYVPPTLLGIRDIAVNKTDISVLSWSFSQFSSQTTQGNRLSCRDQEGRRGSEEAVPGPSVFPSREPGVSGEFWVFPCSPTAPLPVLLSPHRSADAGVVLPV